MLFHGGIVDLGCVFCVVDVDLLVVVVVILVVVDVGLREVVSVVVVVLLVVGSLDTDGTVSPNETSSKSALTTVATPTPSFSFLLHDSSSGSML